MNCKICQKPASSFYDDYMKCQTYHCKACEFIFKDEEAIISHDKELKVYQQHNNTEENLGYVAMFQDFIDKTITPHKEQIKTTVYIFEQDHHLHLGQFLPTPASIL